MDVILKNGLKRNIRRSVSSEGFYWQSLGQEEEQQKISFFTLTLDGERNLFRKERWMDGTDK